MEKISLDASIEEIVKELDDKKLLYLTSGKIKELKNNILQKLQFSRNELLHFHKVLEEYRYVDELDEIKIGAYIRWFNLKQVETIKLTNGGFIVDVQNNGDEIRIVCKNKLNRFFSLKIDECILFQKINTQEKLLIKIIDYVSK